MLRLSTSRLKLKIVMKTHRHSGKSCRACNKSTLKKRLRARSEAPSIIALLIARIQAFNSGVAQVAKTSIRDQTLLQIRTMLTVLNMRKRKKADLLFQATTAVSNSN